MTNCEKLLRLRIVQQRFGIYTTRKLDYYKSLMPPFAFEQRWLDALNDILAVMSRNDRGDCVNIRFEPPVVMHSDVEDEISLHLQSSGSTRLELVMAYQLVSRLRSAMGHERRLTSGRALPVYPDSRQLAATS